MLNIVTIILILADITAFSCYSGVLQHVAWEPGIHSSMGELWHWKGRCFFPCIFIIDQNV